MTRTFSSEAEHLAFIEQQARMPRGFRAGHTQFAFTPAEVDKPAKMNLTVIAADAPVADFAAVYTRNALAGAPVLVGRQRLQREWVQAIVVNNKISNVGVATGVQDAESICAAVGAALGIPSDAVLPASTGVIGWRLPVQNMVSAAPAAVAQLSPATLANAARTIMTTDLYPKARTAPVGEGCVTGIVKGAGMIEPNMATMLGFILTDLAVPRDVLRAALKRVVDRTFNAISIDSDTSTSDMIVALSSGKVPCPDVSAFEAALLQVCRGLAEDVVRNGEGVHHVMKVSVSGAGHAESARAIGKSVVNSPLVKTAVCGNDPNVGRLLCAIGKAVGAQGFDLPMSRLRVTMGGHTLFADGSFVLSRELEGKLLGYLRDTELYRSTASAEGHFVPPVRYPVHERCVEIGIDFGSGGEEVTVIGADLSHEYVSENADYRS